MTDEDVVWSEYLEFNTSIGSIRVARRARLRQVTRSTASPTYTSAPLQRAARDLILDAEGSPSARPERDTLGRDNGQRLPDRAGSGLDGSDRRRERGRCRRLPRRAGAALSNRRQTTWGIPHGNSAERARSRRKRAGNTRWEPSDRKGLGAKVRTSHPVRGGGTRVELLDVRNGLAVYRSGQALRVLRLVDGRDVSMHVPRTPAHYLHAGFGDAGLVAAHVAESSKRARQGVLTLIRWPTLDRLLARRP